MQPIDPDLETLAIFVGTFVGIVVAAFLASRWSQEGGNRTPPTGLRRLVSLFATVVVAVLLATGTMR